MILVTILRMQLERSVNLSRGKEVKIMLYKCPRCGKWHTGSSSAINLCEACYERIRPRLEESRKQFREVELKK